jgi:nucleoside phosphorylase
VPWLLFKTVSDLGDGAKGRVHSDEDTAQRAASHLAMEVVLAAAKNGLL